MWLILELSGSGAALGLHSVLRFGPVILMGTYGGLLSDRLDRKRLIIMTQMLHAMIALVLTVVVFAPWWDISVAMIYGAVLIQGIINSLDNPLRRTFVRDLASDDEIANAISMNVGVMTLGRTIGPAIAGVIIATLGADWAFFANALSFTAVVVALMSIDRSTMRQVAPAPRQSGQLREGLAYARRTPEIAGTLAIVATVGIFAWYWQVVLPVYASDTFEGGPSLYGTLLALVSLGSVLGALLVARRKRIVWRHVLVSAAGLAIALLVASIAPYLGIAIVGLLMIGASSSSFTVQAQARIHLNVGSSRKPSHWSLSEWVLSPFPLRSSSPRCWSI